MTTPAVLVFDVNETLIDIESLAPLFADLFGDERMLREWFAQLIMYSMGITLADTGHVTFPVLAGEFCACWVTSTGWRSPTTTSIA